MTPDPNCRENPGRSVYLGGEITDKLIDSIAPQILRFKAESLEPITVYINSVGGNTDCADALAGLLQSHNCEKKRPWIITVAVGKAKSAATDLLVFGDYAIAYPKSQIHFHGVRFAGVKDVTVERASAYASFIAEENSKMAIRLAEASIHRAVFRYAMQKSKFDEVRKRLNQPDLSDLECFARAIFAKVRSERVEQVVKRAFNRCEAIEKMSEYVVKRLGRYKPSNGPVPQSLYDTRIFKAILDYELKHSGQKELQLDSDGLAVITQDYMLLRDYHWGDHNRSLRNMVNRFGRSFLYPEQSKEYDKMAGAAQEDRDKWLEEKIGEKVKMFWYYVVCVWRNLQEEENPLSPEEAYWLGAVDEVAGTNLAALRRTLESQVQEKPKQEQSN